MTRLERICHQRALAHEAMGKLRALTEFFGSDDEDRREDGKTYDEFVVRIDDLETWIFRESGIA